MVGGVGVGGCGWLWGWGRIGVCGCVHCAMSRTCIVDISGSLAI